MFCKNCGADIGEAKFCPNCGSKVEEQNQMFSNQQTPQVQSQVPPNVPYGKQPKKKNKLGQVFLGVAVFCVVLAILLVIINPSEPNDNGVTNQNQTKITTTSAPPLEISAESLLAAYKDNEVSADNAYKGKKIAVTGIVDTIGKDVLDNTYVTVGTGEQYEITSVQCYITKNSIDKAAQLKKGDTIIIVGTCDGSSLNVIVKNCDIQ